MASSWAFRPAVSRRRLASPVWSAGGTCDPGRMIWPTVAVPAPGGVERNAPLRVLCCPGRGIQAILPRRPLARRDLGTSDESVLREQSRRAVASGAEAGTVAPGRATNLAGCARPARSARRARRGRDRRAPGALERASRPKRHRRRVFGAVISELRSSQLGPGPRVTPTCRSTARPRLLNHAQAPSRRLPPPIWRRTAGAAERACRHRPTRPVLADPERG